MAWWSSSQGITFSGLSTSLNQGVSSGSGRRRGGCEGTASVPFPGGNFNEVALRVTLVLADHTHLQPHATGLRDSSCTSHCRFLGFGRSGRRLQPIPRWLKGRGGMEWGGESSLAFPLKNCILSSRSSTTSDPTASEGGSVSCEGEDASTKGGFVTRDGAAFVAGEKGNFVMDDGTGLVTGDK